MSYALRELERGFRSKSSFQCFEGCVGAVDGLIIKTRQPRYPSENFNPAECHEHRPAFDKRGIPVTNLTDDRLRPLLEGVTPTHTRDKLQIQIMQQLHIKHGGQIACEPLAVGTVVLHQ